MSAVNKQFKLVSRPVGLVKRSDFELVTAPVGEPGPGEVVIEVQYISLDPAMRGWMKEGKSYVTISVGCTGGHHRSVFVINELARHFQSKEYRVRVTHRDSEKT